MALSTIQKAGWGLADMGIVVFVVVKQILILAFLTTYLGVPFTTAGLLTTGVLVFDIITDPLIGYFSDRTATRWGRRAPWMAAGAVVLAGATVGMFAADPAAGPTAALWWVGSFFVLATIGFTMVAIPYGAMAGEMTQDPRERSTMTGWRMGFASVGILIGGAVIPALAGNTAEGHMSAAITVAPAIIGAIWLSIFLTRKAPRIDMPAQASLRESLGLVLSNKAFSALFVLYGVMTLAVAMVSAGLGIAAIYLIGYGPNDPFAGAANGLGVFALLFAAFVIGSILSQAIWVILSHRLGKLQALTAGLTLYAVLLVGMYMVLPATSLVVMFGMFILAGFMNGSYQQIPWAMYPDLMDVTRAETGAAIEGAFSAVWLFGQKVANALAPGLVGIILGAYGFIETTEGKIDQPQAALDMLRIVISLVPSAILVVAVLGLVVIYRPRARALLGG